MQSFGSRISYYSRLANVLKYTRAANGYTAVNITTGTKHLPLNNFSCAKPNQLTYQYLWSNSSFNSALNFSSSSSVQRYCYTQSVFDLSGISISGNSAMSDDEKVASPSKEGNEEEEETPAPVLPFCVGYDKRGQAKCKVCKNKFEKGQFRIGKNGYNPFGGGPMKMWHHLDCLFQSFRKARATTKKIDDVEEDIEDWAEINDEDKDLVAEALKEFHSFCKAKGVPSTTTPKKDTPKKPAAKAAATSSSDGKQGKKEVEPKEAKPDPVHAKFAAKDNSFREFRRMCANIAEESSYLAKTEVVHKFFTKGTGGDKFRGDLETWVRLLLPGVIKRVYNLQSKQLVKVFAQVFACNHEEMLEDLEGGDVAETVRVFFEKSRGVQASAKSDLTMADVDKWLGQLEGMSKEEEQVALFSRVARKCTSNDLKMVVRLVKADLRINAGAKHILEGVHPDAYEAFQTTRNISAVLQQVKDRSSGEASANGLSRSLSIRAKVLTPVLPMLAMACKSVEQAFKKCPNGMYSEIKYDGERVQLHKTGSEFKYFSRSLKPVMDHKVTHFSEYIPSAFPHGNDLILDAEVLLVDTNTGNPLPFGTLGVHKKSEFTDAKVCLFVFDCIHYNGENLMKKPLRERREILLANMTEVPHRVQFSEMQEIHKPEHLRTMIARVLSEGLEGLVLKDIKSIYEPGKRHWLKVKKDYLADGAMADAADLVVLGAWYGTGKKGGMMSVFLMGCLDPRTNKWCTVTKVHTGIDDAGLEKLQKELEMEKISGEYDRVPSWLNCSRTMTPDFVAKDPKKSPVWEITGAEFTQNQIHSANGISIRFPRVTKQRDDKNWQTATDLPLLKELFKTSGEKDFGELMGVSSTSKKTSESSKNGSSSDQEQEKDKKRKDKDQSNGGSEKRKDKDSSRDSDKKKRKRDDEESGSSRESSKPRDGSDKKRKKGSCDDAGDTSATKGVKRSHDDSDEEDKKASGKKEKVPCRYGKQCYNTSQHHLAQFLHPPEHHFCTTNPLPDELSSVKVHFRGSVDRKEVLTRYIVAYGGEVLPDHHRQQATHSCVATSTTSLQDQQTVGGILVTVDWLWDSIKLLKKQPEELYAVAPALD